MLQLQCILINTPYNWLRIDLGKVTWVILLTPALLQGYSDKYSFKCMHILSLICVVQKALRAAYMYTYMYSPCF